MARNRICPRSQENTFILMFPKHQEAIASSSLARLEYVAINDVLSFKAARRDAIQKLKLLGASNATCR